MARCRSCRQEIRYITTADGKRCPVDAAPSWGFYPLGGTLRVLDREPLQGWTGAEGAGYTHRKGWRCRVGDVEDGFRMQVTWVVHFGTCPNRVRTGGAE